MRRKFNKVKGFYDEKLWNLYMVCNAVDRWITADEFQEITGKDYEKKERE